MFIIFWSNVFGKMDAVNMHKKNFMVAFLLVFLQISLISAKRIEVVTCNSVIKLLNTDYNVRLHSHDIVYGTGSGQQSVTAINTKEDGNSYWLIKGSNRNNCIRGRPIKCGDVVRFEHTTTKKNLHSHLVSSPLSGRQEVSAYGNNGEGDTGDDWTVECVGTHWERNETIMLKHIDTDVYLAVTGRTYAPPISGQHEVVGEYSTNSYSKWQAMEGLFIHPNDFKFHHIEHTEL